jgi:uncharacterized protein
MSQQDVLSDDASPCTGVCRLDITQVCEGCGRHINEIAGWSSAPPAQRRAWRHLADARLRGENNDASD